MHEDAVAERVVGVGDGVPGNATLTVVVDAAEGTLRTVRFERARTEADGEREYRGTVWRFADWGATAVRRPASAGYSLIEFLRDASE